MNKVLPYTDIFVPSLDEILQIMNPGVYSEILSPAVSSDIIDKAIMKSIREIGRKFINYGVKILLIKAGHLGAYLITGDVSSINEKATLTLSTEKWNNCELWCKAYKADPVKIRNSSGAGDTAVAAFLTAILQGEDPDSSVKYAAMAGRNSLYCKDIYNDLINWQQMAEEIKVVDNKLIKF